MWKLIYELFTSPLGLPIDPIWEWVILFAASEVAHEIAYWLSPGGKVFGSAVYWGSKFLVFVGMWALLYGIITVVQFIAQYWVWIVCTGLGIGIIVGIIIWIYRFKKRKNKRE